MSTSSFSGGKSQPTGTQQSSQQSSQQARPSQLSQGAGAGTQQSSQQARLSQLSQGFSAPMPAAATSSQQSSSGTKNKQTVFITAADSLAGASLVNNLAKLGAQRFGKIILAVDTDSNINDKIDTSKLTNIEVQRLDFKNPDMAMLKKSLAGVDVLALIPPKSETKFVFSRALLKAADELKVDFAVLLSWTGTNAIDTASGSDFKQLSEIKKLEDEFQRECKGIKGKAVVRANFYAQNLVTYAKQIVEQNTLPIPTESGKFAPLDAEMLGAALAKMLGGADSLHKHASQTYTLTGPVALDADGIAKELSKALGSDVKAKQITMDEARTLLGKAQPPLAKSEIDTIVETYTLVKQGRLDQTSSDLMKLLDMQHPPLHETIKRDVPMFKKVSSL